MYEHDEFDEAKRRGRPDFRAAVGAIFSALDRRDKVEPRRPVWAAAIVGSLVIFLIGVLWYSYPREAEKSETMAAPIVRADAGPVKIVPSDPGGMEIPHRDSTVFETLHASRSGNGAERYVENLLEGPEEPVDRDEFFSGLKAAVRVEGREVVSAQEAQKKEKVAVAVQDIAEPVKNKPVIAAAKPVPPARPEKDIAEEVSRTEPAAGVETFKNSGGGWYAQLASLRSQDSAQTAWKDLQKSMSVLKGLDHRVERADLGARGVYYRLQAGPFAEGRAREICAAVEAQRPGGCLVVKN